MNQGERRVEATETMLMKIDKERQERENKVIGTEDEEETTEDGIRDGQAMGIKDKRLNKRREQ